MPGDQIRAFIDRHAEGWNRHDAAALASDHAADGVVESPMFGHVEGREQIAGSYAALFAVFPDWYLEFEAPIVQGDRVAVHFSVRATHRGELMGVAGTGRRCVFEGVSMFRLDADFRIAEERRVYDFTGLLAQVAVLRVRPSH